MNIFNLKKKFDYELIGSKITSKDGIIALIFWTNTRIYNLFNIRDYYIGINSSVFYDWLYIVPYNVLLFVGLIAVVKSRNKSLAQWDLT